LAVFFLAGGGEAWGAQPPLPPDIGNREVQRQQEQERQRLQEMQDAQPDVRLQQDAAPVNLEYPESESPCFPIREIRLEGDGADKFQWTLRKVDDAIGRCLGGKGINVVMARVQNAILEKGFTTTRIVAPPQDIKTGILTLKIIPGVVSDVSLTEDSGKYQYLHPMIPVRKGKILNIRDIEQGLENLRRIPTVQTDFKLVPGENEGESRVEVMRKQGRPVRVMLSADDSGSRYTGKTRARPRFSSTTCLA
jgi:hemolysin activation/secretion protein